MIVYGTPGSLLAAQVSFRRLYGNVAQRKLNLLQLTASRMAEPGLLPGCAGQVCRGHQGEFVFDD
jgi:hypothetical protein